MKRLTIFRTCAHNAVYGTLKQKSAYQLFLRTKLYRQNIGKANLIISSHIPEAMNSASIIQLAMEYNSRIMESPHLSRYYAGRCKDFKKMFLAYAQDNFFHHKHIILVSHKVIISELTQQYIAEGGYLCIEAASWNNIFDFSKNKITIPDDPVQHMREDITPKLSNQDKLLFGTLQFLTD